MRQFKAVLPSNTCLGFALAAALVLCAGLVFSQQAGKHDSSINRFTANLSAGGFDWSEGSVIKVDPAALCCEGKLPFGLYFNKLTPYVGVLVPRPGVPTPKNPLPFIQLAANEAVVLIGVTPPEAKYFGYQLYLGERSYPGATTDDFFAPHTLLFASVGDPVNLRTIRTNGPDPFNRPVVFVFTPDQVTDARVRAALQSAGYPDSIINTVVIPSRMLRLGMDPWTDDVLLIIHRMAQFADKPSGDNYFNAFGSDNPPLRAFRITPRTSGPLRPFPAAPLRIRGTGHGELDLTPGLDQLRQAILDKNNGYTATEYVTRPVFNDGFDFIQRAADAAADTRDALYLGAGAMRQADLYDLLTLREDEFLIAYGPKHAATGKATYANINVYATKPQLPLGSVFDDSFDKSTDAYLPGADPLFYAYKIKRDCHGEDFCLSLSQPYEPCTPACLNPPCPTFIFNEKTPLSIMWRNYLEPSTKIGPAFTEILYDRLIKFSPK